MLVDLGAHGGDGPLERGGQWIQQRSDDSGHRSQSTNALTDAVEAAVHATHQRHHAQGPKFLTTADGLRVSTPGTIMSRNHGAGQEAASLGSIETMQAFRSASVPRPSNP